MPSHYLRWVHRFTFRLTSARDWHESLAGPPSRLPNVHHLGEGNATFRRRTVGDRARWCEQGDHAQNKDEKRRPYKPSPETNVNHYVSSGQDTPRRMRQHLEYAREPGRVALFRTRFYKTDR
jgi:hypothetical protein